MILLGDVSMVMRTRSFFVYQNETVDDIKGTMRCLGPDVILHLTLAKCGAEATTMPNERENRASIWFTD
jgi:hypothetical protein